LNDVAVELCAIMLGRIVKFRRGDQYEEMQGRDVAGKTGSSGQTGADVNSRDQPNQQTDGGAGKSMSAALDTTPDGTFFHAVLSDRQRLLMFNFNG